MATINPFQGPINYAVDVQSPFEAAIGGFKLGAAGVEAQAQATARANAANAQAQLTRLYENPFATAADYDKVVAFLPKDQAAIVTQNFERKTKEQQQNTLQQASQVYSALKSGQPIVAKKLLTDQAAAYRTAGREQEAKATETYLQMIDINQPGAQTTIGLMIAALPGGKDLLENVDKTLSTIRVEEKAPSELASSKAAAEKAGAEAKVATGSVDAEITKRKADAEKALSDATAALATADNAQAKAKAEADYEAAKARKEKADADVAAGTVAARIAEGVKVKLAPSVQESIDYANLTSEQKTTFDTLQVLKKPPAAVTNINVNNLEKTAEGELGKLVPDLYEQANSAVTQVQDIPRYRTALQNAIVGPLANARLTADQIGQFLGFTGDKRINATRELIQGLSEMALKSRSMLTGQGSITEGEQALLLKARSGDISFTKGELDIILNVADRAARAQYDKSTNLLRSASTKSTTAQMFLDNVKALPTGEPPSSPNTVKVGDMTYTRPANFTDKQWADYKQQVGAK